MSAQLEAVARAIMEADADTLGYERRSMDTPPGAESWEAYLPHAKAALAAGGTLFAGLDLTASTVIDLDKLGPATDLDGNVLSDTRAGSDLDAELRGAGIGYAVRLAENIEFITRQVEDAVEELALLPRIYKKRQRGAQYNERVVDLEDNARRGIRSILDLINRPNPFTHVDLRRPEQEYAWLAGFTTDRKEPGPNPFTDIVHRYAWTRGRAHMLCSGHSWQNPFTAPLPKDVTP